MLERREWSRPITPGSSGVEFAADGVTPTAIKIWGPGENQSTKGSVFFTDKSAILIMAAFKERGMPLMWDYDHESTVPPEERRAAASSGFGCASAHFSTLELRGADGASSDGFDQELWSARIEWTKEAREQIVSGKRRQVSPYFATEKDTAEIVELYSMALCFEGATNKGRILSPLQMRLYSRGQRMDQIIEALRAAVEAGDWEQVKAALAALEQLTPGTGDVAAVKAAVDEAVQAAFRKHARIPAPAGETEAVRLAREAGERATLEVRKERVAALIDRNPDLISKETETFLLSRADVDTAKVIFAELGRSEKRQHGRNDLRPPAGGGDVAPELSEAERRQAAANGVAPEKMAAARERMRHGRVGTRQNGGR